MRITKFGHACVRIDSAGASLVIDPGSLTDRAAVEGATAVLVTHQHPDHLDLDHLRAAEVPVFTIAAVAERIAEAAPDLDERVTVVSSDEEFDAGIPVRAVGEWHAVIHADLPLFRNCGYVVSADDQTIYHPGDSFTVPDQRVDVLCLPITGPWMKMSESIDFARAVGAPRNLGIHDGGGSDFGLKIVDTQTEALLGSAGLGYTRLTAGQELPQP